MKKKNLLTSLIFLVTLGMLCVPLVMVAHGAANQDTFNVTVSLDNVVPTISWVENVSKSPTGGGTRVITINFNATDNNSAPDLSTSTAYVNISYLTTTRQSSACVNQSQVGNTRMYNCSITIFWYDASASWNVVAYIKDAAGATANYTTMLFYMGSTDDVTVVQDSISWSGVSPGDQDIGSNNDPVTVNNTGNVVYTSIELTAQSLTGGASTIGAGNFSVNVTDAATGQALVHNGAVSISSSALSAGATATKNLYFYLDVPLGIEATTYGTGGTPWLINPQ